MRRSRDPVKLATYGVIVCVSTLVVGDVMLDEHLWGSADGLLPEADAPTLRVGRTELSLGGAGNAAANAAGLGARTHLLAAVGADEAGAAIRDLDGASRHRDELRVDDGAVRRRGKSRVHTQGRQLVRFDREDTRRRSVPRTRSGSSGSASISSRSSTSSSSRTTPRGP